MTLILTGQVIISNLQVNTTHRIFDSDNFYEINKIINLCFPIKFLIQISKKKLINK